MKAIILGYALCLTAASQADASACLFKREQASGRYKICYYACPAGEVAETIRATRLCPLKIEH